MTLRLKVPIILLTIVFIVSGGYAALERWIILPNFRALERQEALTDMTRARLSLVRELDYLSDLANDWAAWEATYNFAADRNAGYIADNLTVDSFTDNDLDLITLRDTDGRLIWGRNYDPDTGRRLPESPLTAGRMALTSPLLNLPSTPGCVAGFTVTDRGPMLTVCRPILHNDSTGPSRGFLTMGRVISQPDWDRLSEQVQVHFRGGLISGDLSPMDDKALKQLGNGGPPVVVMEEEGGPLQVFTTLPDVGGRPVLLIRATVPRKIMARAGTVLNTARLTMAGTAIIALAAMILLLHRTVVRPVTRLTDHVDAIARGGDLEARLHWNRNDEIGRLAYRFGRLMDRLKDNQDRTDRLNQALTEDIERRKRTEEELVRTHRTLETMVQTVPFGVVLVDGERRIRLANPPAAEVMGRTDPKELIGSWWRPVLRLESQEAAAAPSGDTGPAEGLLKTGPGREVEIIHSAVRVEIDGEELSLETFVDLTPLRRTERALAEREAQYQAIFRSAGVGLMICDMKGVIVDVNDQAVQMHGLTRVEMVSRPLRELVAVDSLPELGRFLSMDWSSRPTFETRMTLRGSGDREMEVEFRGAGFIHNGQPHLLAIIMDISVQRQLEEQLVHSQKMEAVGTLSAGIAHDFNNLMQAISGYSHLLRTSFPPGDSRAGFLDGIDSTVERAARRVKGLLAFSNRVEPEFRPLDLNLQVEKTLDLLKMALPANIELTFRPDEELWLVRGDPGLLEQVLVNLATNAHEAMPGGGVLSLVTANLSAAQAASQGQPGPPDGDQVTLSVTDTGCGIEPDLLPRLFDPFFSTRGIGQGSGLGLAISYGIIEGHGGTITVDSAPDRGSVFTIHLPRLSPGES